METMFRQNTIPREAEQLTFIHTIYHCLNGGVGIRISIMPDRKNPDGEKKVVTYAKRESALDQLQYRGKRADAYLAMSVHSTGRRREENLYNRSVFFIDLDGHDVPKEELDNAKKNAQECLDAAFSSGKLPVPCMITDTGRGYGIFYVLERSIPHTPNTVKIEKLFDFVYRELITAYQGVLEGQAFSVDTRVTDSSRVARLPGTMNKSCNRMCRLVGFHSDADGNPVYSVMDDLKAFATAHSKGQKKKEKRSNFMHKMRWGETIAHDRIEKFFLFTEKMDGDMIGCREYCVFQVANTAISVMPWAEVKEKAYSLNRMFTEPLSDAEVDAVLRGQNLGKYKYKEETIVNDLLSMKPFADTPGVLSACGFGCGIKRAIRRAKEKAENQAARKKTWETVAEYARSNPNDTYAQIAEAFGFSESYVQKKMREMGICRNHTKEKESAPVQVTKGCSAKPEKKSARTKKAKPSKPASDDSATPASRAPSSQKIRPEDVLSFAVQSKPLFFDRLLKKLTPDAVRVSYIEWGQQACARYLADPHALQLLTFVQYRPDHAGLAHAPGALYRLCNAVASGELEGNRLLTAFYRIPLIDPCTYEEYTPILQEYEHLGLQLLERDRTVSMMKKAKNEDRARYWVKAQQEQIMDLREDVKSSMAHDSALDNTTRYQMGCYYRTILRHSHHYDGYMVHGIWHSGKEVCQALSAMDAIALREACLDATERMAHGPVKHEFSFWLHVFMDHSSLPAPSHRGK